MTAPRLRDETPESLARAMGGRWTKKLFFVAREQAPKPLIL